MPKLKKALPAPAVTVLLSVYNNAATIDKTLESVASQTRMAKIVCINDASTDDTAKKLLRWQEKLGPALRVVANRQNLGLTKSLNDGLKLVQTDYTARIDADDWWEPNKLALQLKYLRAHPEYGVVGCWYTNHGRKAKHLIKPPVEDQAIRQTIIRRNPFAHSCVVFKTELIRSLGGYDEQVRYGQDYELWLRALNSTKFHNIPRHLCHRSITAGISIEKQRDQMRQAFQTQLKYIRQYRLSLINYFYTLEPLLVSLTPRFIANLKRRFTDR